jgi:choline dehydrogenase-like flavoprotein
MIIDLNLLSDTSELKQYDVCICGSGPAGITVARTLAAKGKSVALLEGGSLAYTEESQKLYEGKSIGINDWDAVENCRLRFFGGTSNHWSGLCSFFDDTDFESRPDGIPGWPISKTEAYKYFDNAKEILDLPKNAFLNTPKWLGSNFKSFVNAKSPPTRFNIKYQDELKKSDNIDLFINANLINIQLVDDLKTIKYLEVKNYKKVNFLFTAKQFVLAMGTIENARMLLASNKQIKSGIGNQHDMVGRCYMEHFNIGYGRFVVENQKFWKNGSINLNPSVALIKKTKIGNAVISFDPSFKVVSYGRTRALKQAIRNLICKSENATEFSRKLVDFNCEGDGFITSMIEQSPNRDSRVTLDTTHDVFGVPQVILNWQFNQFDMHSIRTIGMEVAKEMARLGVARVQLVDYILDKNLPIRDIGHHCHQMGTTRMSADPKHGVVNENLRVHGSNNLYVAGSSVFPTGGGCNPTFTLTMLAIRLGEHIAMLG